MMRGKQPQPPGISWLMFAGEVCDRLGRPVSIDVRQGPMSTCANVFRDSLASFTGRPERGQRTGCRAHSNRRRSSSNPSASAPVSEEARTRERPHQQRDEGPGWDANLTRHRLPAERHHMLSLISRCDTAVGGPIEPPLRSQRPNRSTMSAAPYAARRENLLDDTDAARSTVRATAKPPSCGMTDLRRVHA